MINKPGGYKWNLKKRKKEMDKISLTGLMIVVLVEPR